MGTVTVQLLADVREPLPPQPGRPGRQDCEHRRGGAGNATSSCSVVSHGLPGHAPAGRRTLCQPRAASSRPGRQAGHRPLCQPGAGAALPLRGLWPHFPALPRRGGCPRPAPADGGTGYAGVGLGAVAAFCQPLAGGLGSSPVPDERLAERTGGWGQCAPQVAGPRAWPGAGHGS